MHQQGKPTKYGVAFNKKKSNFRRICLIFTSISVFKQKMMHTIMVIHSGDGGIK